MRRGRRRKGRPSGSREEDSPRGFALALGAYFLWGFIPLYLKMLDAVPPLEVIAHRVIWSVPVAGAVLWVTGRTADLLAALRSPRTLGMSAVAASIITVNWGIYIWAVVSGRAMDAALGYFINPLFSVLVGAVVLRERLSRAQKVAVAFAAAGVAVVTLDGAGLPWAAIGLTTSWTAYAYLKKMLPIGPNQGFFLEVLLLGPALAVWAVLAAKGEAHFLAGDAGMSGLLVGAGILTAVPLMLYANGAKLLRLSTIAIMQYVAPTMVFLTALFVFHEPFGRGRMVAFALIWSALVIYTVPLIRQMRRG